MIVGAKLAPHVARGDPGPLRPPKARSATDFDWLAGGVALGPREPVLGDERLVIVPALMLEALGNEGLRQRRGAAEDDRLHVGRQMLAKPVLDRRADPGQLARRGE